MRAVIAKIPGIAVYLAFVGSLGAACGLLGLHVGTQVMALAMPFVALEGERAITLVERRQIETPAVAVRSPAISSIPASIAARVAVSDTPALPLGLLAARMDLSERADHAPAVRAVRRLTRARVRARPTKLAAADAFGRSFGVLLMASR